MENLAIVSPDTGGTHRAKAFLNRLERESHGSHAYTLALIDKDRPKPGMVGEMTLIGEVEGKNVLLVDDMISSGGTLVKAAELLKGKGAKRMMCYGAHGLFTEGTKKLKSAYDTIITSNSHRQKDKSIEIVDVSRLFGEAMYRAQHGLSISKLFE